MQKYIETYISSREAAEMIEKDHAMLLRDLRRYTKQFNECNLAVVEFFQESTYKDNKGEERPCYNITKKGCEFIAHKLTGTKGTVFTARYINRFHEMGDIISHYKARKEIFIMPKLTNPILAWLIYLKKHYKSIDFSEHNNYNSISGIQKGGKKCVATNR